MLPLLFTIIALLIVTILLILVFRPKGSQDNTALVQRMDQIGIRLQSIEQSLREEGKNHRTEYLQAAAQNRDELGKGLSQFRTEIIMQLQQLQEQQQQTLLQFSQEQQQKGNELKQELKEGAAQTIKQLEKTTLAIEQKLQQMMEQDKADAHLLRQTLESSFKGFRDQFAQSINEMNNTQRERLGQMEEKQVKLVDATEKKLEHIRETVEEKLQKTLQERLGQSFDMVSKQLNAVQQGLGEMQTLAQDVGGLKKVLSNVKMRGGFGEVQLHMLLENILAPEQYEANVATKKGSAERVEFAVKFPNRENDREYVWLPIDAKFPKDAYEHLQNAYDAGDSTAIDAAQKNLENVIRKMARDICEKYLDAPHTTNFGILFLPFEGLFAEVVRKSSLLEEIQRDCQVVITGPTTLAVILNSLQMGFRTLAIQKRSSEVWQILGGVKKEFEAFGGMLEKAQKNIQTGLNQLDDVVGVRTRAIQRKLKNVEILEAPEMTASLPLSSTDEEEEA